YSAVLGGPTLSLHDALPIYRRSLSNHRLGAAGGRRRAELRRDVAAGHGHQVSRPNTESSFCVPSYTLPFATVGTANLTAGPAAGARPFALVGLAYSLLARLLRRSAKDRRPYWGQMG